MRKYFSRRTGLRFLSLLCVLGTLAAVSRSAETAPPMPPAAFGMCSNANYLGNPDYRARMQEAGAQTVRLDFAFPEVRKEPGDDPDKWDWSKMETLTRLKKEKPKREFLMILGYGVAWAANPAADGTKGGISSPQRDILALPVNNPTNLYGHYVYETVRRYRNVTRYWESWNEPDLPNHYFFAGNGKDFFAYQKVCYLAAKKADPNCKVLFAAMCYGNTEGYLALHGLNAPSIAPPTSCFFEEYLQACVKDPDAKKNNYYFDLMNQHSYSRATDLYDYTMIDRKLMHDYLGTEKPIWITEMGFPDKDGPFGGNDDDYCDYMLQSYAWGALAGVARFFHFQLDNSNGHGLYTGMLGEPKPVLTTYRDVLTREFTGATLVRQWHGNRGIGFLAGNSAYKPTWQTGYNLFEFRGADHRRRWIAFADTDKEVTIQIPVQDSKTAKTTATLIDRHNKRTPLDAKSGFFTVTLAGATNRAGWPTLPEPKAKALGEPEHLVGGSTVVIVE